MYGFRGSLPFWLVVGGILLIYNCIRGISSGEGMYDRESSNIMFWSQLLGIVLGLGLLAWGIILFRLVYFY